MPHATSSTPTLWPPSFDAAIFDFDGTLAETSGLWQQVDVEFFSQRHLPYTHDARLELTTRGFTDGAQWVIQRYGLDETSEEICDQWKRMGSALYATDVELRPGAERYLQALRERGVRLALATTNARTVLLSMQQVDVEKLFDVVVSGTEVPVPKREPDIYLEAVRRMGVEPARCIVFEDIVPGIRSARRVGMATCAVACKDPAQDFRLVAAEADLAIRDWREVMR